VSVLSAARQPQRGGSQSNLAGRRGVEERLDPAMHPHWHLCLSGRSQGVPRFARL
jgi:hypothetical protein